MKQKGFSIVELIIVLAIFSVVLGVAVSMLISIINEQRTILAKQELVNQTSYVAEYISKPLRLATKDLTGSCLGVVGYVYVLTHCAGGNCSGIKFINTLDNNACEEFFLDTTNPASPTLEDFKNGTTKNNILSSKLTIRHAQFIINGNKTKLFASASDTVEPRVTMLLDVQTQAGITPVQEQIIQTTVSQRNAIP